MKSKLNFFEFIPYSYDSILSYLSIRDGETKLGEKVCFDYNSPSCKYVIVGISEDIGPQANFGLKGSDNAFKSFVSRFVNVQSNRFLSGTEICLLGEIIQTYSFSKIDEARDRIEILDEFVQMIVSPIITAGKIPIVIGGGHNNAYPIICASSTSIKSSINVINLDPHADCRALEGRHSGNPFSYANSMGHINHYTVLGLHQQYNSESILNYLDQNNFTYTFFEDYIDQKRFLKKDVQTFSANRNKDTYIGIELDLDSISMMPSSAFSPSGFSIEEARIYIREIAKQNNILYLHLPEGSPQSILEEKIVGKTLAYLVTDFIKENSILSVW